MIETEKIQKLNPYEECDKIKHLLQFITGFENIGDRSRKRELIDAKNAYYKLCSIFTEATQSVMGEALGGYDHATALNGIKTFNNLYKTKGYTCNKVYDDAFDTLIKNKAEMSRTHILAEINRHSHIIKINELAIRRLINELVELEESVS